MQPQQSHACTIAVLFLLHTPSNCAKLFIPVLVEARRTTSSPPTDWTLLGPAGSADWSTGCLGTKTSQAAQLSATAAFMVAEPTDVLRQSTAGLIRFMSMRSLYCAPEHKSPQLQCSLTQSDGHTAGDMWSACLPADLSYFDTNLKMWLSHAVHGGPF